MQVRYNEDGTEVVVLTMTEKNAFTRVLFVLKNLDKLHGTTMAEILAEFPAVADLLAKPSPPSEPI